MADVEDLRPRFDWRNPDYALVFERRTKALIRIREAIKAERADGVGEPFVLNDLKAYYREHIAEFINDWGVTYDPRNPERGLPATIPFLLFPKQFDFVRECVGQWRAQEPLIAEKSRDCGVSWLIVGIGAAMCLLMDGVNIGYGSRKEEYVDLAGNPKSLFWKARQFIGGLPREFRGGWDQKRHSAHMRIIFPTTGSAMSGEAGDNIGRGDRQSIYFVDESAYLMRPKLVDAALSATTNCRIDVSSVNGMNNPFAEKRWAGRIKVFIFDWRDDPRKDEAWYEKQKRELDPVVLAQEVDRDYVASVAGAMIPGQWARACLDSHKVLGLAVSGQRLGALDIADEGRDLNAYCSAIGFMVDFITEFSGKGSDTFATTAEAFRLLTEHGDEHFRYDADGIGSGVRGHVRVLNESRSGESKLPVPVPYHGSGEVIDKEKLAPGTERTNEDFFKNFKAQSWWALRQRCYKTWLMVEEAKAIAAGVITKSEAQHHYPAEELLSISSKCGNHQKLIAEMAQATFSLNGEGKVIVDKTPDDMKSPNMADVVVIRYAPMKGAMRVSREAINRAAAYRGRRA